VFQLIGHYMIPSFMKPPYDNLVGRALASFDKNQGHVTIGEHPGFCDAVRYAVKLNWTIGQQC
jgi:hypothetical protein